MKKNTDHLSKGVFGHKLQIVLWFPIDYAVWLCCLELVVPQVVQTGAEVYEVVLLDFESLMGMVKVYKQ